jgi:hypothetical protein
VHFQDIATPGAVGAIDQHLAIKPPRTQQGGIEHLRAIGSGEQDHASARVETIKLGEQLVEGLLLLIIAAERARHAAAS